MCCKYNYLFHTEILAGTLPNSQLNIYASNQLNIPLNMPNCHFFASSFFPMSISFELQV